MTAFTLSLKQEQKLNVWLEEQEKILLQKQKPSMSESDWKDLTSDGEYPYCGAIGGGIQYIFNPTSIGVGVRVKYLPTGEEIDLTDYDEW
jgi:hypothetical protein